MGIPVHSVYSTAIGIHIIDDNAIKIWKILLKLSVWREPEKLLIDSVFHRNINIIKLITKLIIEIEYNIVVFFSVNTKSIKKMIDKPKIGIHSGKIVFPCEKKISSSNFIKFFYGIK
jgi:hypothetical protein